METNRVTVTILGQDYTIRGDADPEYIQKLARYINEKMEEYSSDHSVGSPLQVAILTLLNITDEYFQVRELKSGVDGVVEEKARNLISMLDEGLTGDTFSGIDTISK